MGGSEVGGESRGWSGDGSGGGVRVESGVGGL